MTGYSLDGRGLIPSKGKRFLYSLQHPHWLRGLTQPLIQWVPGTLSLEVKRLGQEADHSPPPSLKVDNGGALPQLPHSSPWCSD
jgi:hypothetical protein